MRRVTANLALLLASLFTAYGVLGLADKTAGAYLTRQLWPGPVGLLFQPGQEDAFEMRDYRCSERINALGFRDRETPLEKTGTYRIVAIGDSFTYGWGVNLEDTWVKQLEKRLREQGLDVEVLNLGKPAAGPNEYAAIATAAIPVLKPDMVIVCCLAGDDVNQVSDISNPFLWARLRFPNLLHAVRYWRNRKVQETAAIPPTRTAEDTRKGYAQVAQQLLDEFTPEQRARYDRLEDAVKESFLAGTLNPWLIGHSTGGPDYFLHTLDLTTLTDAIKGMAKAFRTIRSVARRHDAHALVLSIPEGFYVNREAYANVQRIGFLAAPEMLESNTADEAVAAACRKAGLPFGSVTEGFRQRKDEPGLYFEFDRHMTAKGNALYAELIAPIVAPYVGGAPLRQEERP